MLQTISGFYKKVNYKNIRFIDNLKKKAYNDVFEKIGVRIAH